MQQVDLSQMTYYFGDFSSWEEASSSYRGGYNTSDIFHRVTEATQKVRRGEAVFDRDGVAFGYESYNHELLAALFYVAIQENKLCVLDFGGAVGSTYFQNRKLLRSISLEWHIVEQEMFVRYGKENVPEINFHYRSAECQSLGINCLLISGSLQYLDEPYRYLDEMLQLRPRYIIVDRIAFNIEARDRLVLEYVPEHIYKAVYPCWLFDGTRLTAAFTGYEKVFEWPDYIDRIPLIDGNTARVIPQQGILLKRLGK